MHFNILILIKLRDSHTHKGGIFGLTCVDTKSVNVANSNKKILVPECMSVILILKIEEKKNTPQLEDVN